MKKSVWWIFFGEGWQGLDFLSSCIVLTGVVKTSNHRRLRGVGLLSCYHITPCNREYDSIYNMCRKVIQQLQRLPKDFKNWILNTFNQNLIFDLLLIRSFTPVNFINWDCWPYKRSSAKLYSLIYEMVGIQTYKPLSFFLSIFLFSQHDHLHIYYLQRI